MPEDEVFLFGFSSFTSGVNVRFELFFPTEFRREIVGLVSADVVVDAFLFAMLFFRVDERVGSASVEGVELVPLLPPPRFRFLMTSVLSDRGRTTP